MALGMEMMWELEHLFFGQIGMAFGVLGMFTLRDAMWEGGSRSIGKRLLGLEIVQADGGLIATRGQCIRRNMMLPLWEANGFVFPLVHILFVSDFLTMLSNGRRRRIGDYMGGTIVVDEMPDRKARVESMLWERKQRHWKLEQGEKMEIIPGRLQPDPEKFPAFQPPFGRRVNSLLSLDKLKRPSFDYK
jgi:hypothetical protein